MPAVANGFWLREGYEALTFFGTILTHSPHEAHLMNSRYDALKNHEMIHLRQAQSTGDSWWRFYLLYIWYWLKLLVKTRRPRLAYVLNPFEIEAYRHMYDLDYLKPGRPTDGWRQYRNMTTKELLNEYARQTTTGA